MGLTNWGGSPNGKIVKTDVGVAKNYLTKEELQSMGRIVGAYLDLAEDMAIRQIPMKMEGWAERLDELLKLNRRNLLQDAGTVSAEIAKVHAEGEFEKYRVIQDRKFESDFDKEVKEIEKAGEKKGKNNE